MEMIFVKSLHNPLILVRICMEYLHVLDAQPITFSSLPADVDVSTIWNIPLGNRAVATEKVNRARKFLHSKVKQKEICRYIFPRFRLGYQKVDKCSILV